MWRTPVLLSQHGSWKGNNEIQTWKPDFNVYTLEDLIKSKNLQLAEQEKRSTSLKSEIYKIQDENYNVQLSQQGNLDDWQTRNTI